MKIIRSFFKILKIKNFKNNLFFITTPWWLRQLFKGCVWDIKSPEKIIYLSFDDGPHPTITPWVLAELKKYNAKATFFCIGDNVKKYPEIFMQIINEGHAVGNHTMYHINGWKSTDEKYLNDIAAAQKFIPSNLFRPPYGRIKKSQISKLRHLAHPLQIIMWSVLAGDWITTLSAEQCFNKIKNKIYPGCILVFHDSEKAHERMSYTLPKLLQHCTRQGYKYKKIEVN